MLHQPLWSRSGCQQRRSISQKHAPCAGWDAEADRRPAFRPIARHHDVLAFFSCLETRGEKRRAAPHSIVHQPQSPQTRSSSSPSTEQDYFAGARTSIAAAGNFPRKLIGQSQGSFGRRRDPHLNVVLTVPAIVTCRCPTYEMHQGVDAPDRPSGDQQCRHGNRLGQRRRRLPRSTRHLFTSPLSSRRRPAVRNGDSDLRIRRAPGRTAFGGGGKNAVQHTGIGGVPATVNTCPSGSHHSVLRAAPAHTLPGLVHWQSWAGEAVAPHLPRLDLRRPASTVPAPFPVSLPWCSRPDLPGAFGKAASASTSVRRPHVSRRAGRGGRLLLLSQAQSG